MRSQDGRFADDRLNPPPGDVAESGHNDCMMISVQPGPPDPDAPDFLRSIREQMKREGLIED